MEGKTPFGAVIMGVLILSIVLPQTQAEAYRSCCKTRAARICFNHCRLPPFHCAIRCTCILVDSNQPCRPPYPWITQECSADTVYHYCKLGCASSMCSNLQNSGEEVVNADAVEQCTNACSAFCNKGSAIALESA